MTTGQVFEAVDRLSEAAVLFISLSGGEPLLRRDIIQILERLTSKHFRVDILTNGYWLPPAVVEALKGMPVFQVQVSIDGIGGDHDQFRGRIGAYDAACLTVETLVGLGLAVSVSTTVTSENLGTFERVAYRALELGCSGFKAIQFVPAGRGQANSHLRLDSTGVLRFTEKVERLSQELAGRLNVSTETCFSFLLRPPPEDSPANGWMGCSAGHETLSIGADGTLYPCPFLQVPAREHLGASTAGGVE